MIREGYVQPPHAFEIEEDLTGIEVGILVAEEGEIALVGFGGDRDLPFVVVVVVREVVEG